VLSGDVTSSGQADIRIENDGANVRMIAVGGALYLRGDAAYWRDTGGPQGEQLADQLGGRWVKAPPSGVREYADFIRRLTPESLAECATVGVGTLSVAGTETVRGRRTRKILDAGDQPGTTPGELYVAADGPALPIRILQTGKPRPGGRLDPRCQDEADTSTASDLRFGSFDEPVRITAPDDALEIPDGDGEDRSGATV
jgi:hypothetical protein